MTAAHPIMQQIVELEHTQIHGFDPGGARGGGGGGNGKKSDNQHLFPELRLGISFFFFLENLLSQNMISADDAPFVTASIRMENTLTYKLYIHLSYVYISTKMFLVHFYTQLEEERGGGRALHHTIRHHGLIPSFLYGA